MLATTIVCPHCQKSLKTTQPLAAGKRVSCKQCGTLFVVPATAVHVEPPASLQQERSTAFASTPAPFVEQTGNTASLGKRLVKIALVALILGGSLSLIGGGSVLALLYVAKKDRGTTLAATPLPPPLVNEKPAPTTPPEQPVAVELPSLPPEEQEKVDKAIDKGLVYVKKQTTSWAKQPPRVGLAALQGLTLLECGLSEGDPAVKMVAKYIREQVPHINQTYDTSLAILFLDRLGDPVDENAIQTLALRLIAGQQVDGGWNYHCPLLPSADSKELLTLLQRTRPSQPLDLLRGADGKLAPEFALKQSNGNADGPFQGITKSNPSPEPANDLSQLMKKASPKLKELPVLQPPGTVGTFRNTGPTDNSNTQFAVLAAWVSSRHELPMERTLALIAKHFRTSQDTQGRWGYHYVKSPRVAQGEPAMTCAGLLGVGAGYGLLGGDPETTQHGVQDPVVLNGFKFLSQQIGKPLGVKRKGVRQSINLYFLWSIERVAVMYNVTNIGDKDWYHWGAELLIDHQNPDGGWACGGYPGSEAQVDSCLALLFLKRANLAKDLSRKLEYVIDAKDLGNK